MLDSQRVDNFPKLSKEYMGTLCIIFTTCESKSISKCNVFKKNNSAKITQLVSKSDGLLKSHAF